MAAVFADGSLPYAAPELLLPPPSGVPPVADPAQDIWAVGVMLYAMLAGRLPFTDQFEPRLQMKIIHGASLFLRVLIVYTQLAAPAACVRQSVM